jgi:hypothetical protein
VIDRYRRLPRWARWAIPMIVVLGLAAVGSSSSKKTTGTATRTITSPKSANASPAKSQQAECEKKRTAAACGWPKPKPGPSASLAPIGHSAAVAASSGACKRTYLQIQPLLRRLRNLSEEAVTQTESLRALAGPYEAAGKQVQTDASELETKVVNHADEPIVTKVSEGIASIASGAIGVGVGLKAQDAGQVKTAEEEVVRAAVALARVGERYGLRECVRAVTGTAPGG